MKKITVIIILFANCLLESCSYLPAQNRSTKIYGHYYYSAADSLSGIRLDVNNDGTFSYSAGSDVRSVHSYGKWIYKNDTLVLNSLIDKKSIPIAVEELTVDTLSGKVVLNLENILDREIIGGIIRINGDTTSECIPLFATGCDHELGSVRNFRVDFINGARSQWYELKNPKANLIRITSNTRDIEAMSIVNQKYLYKSDRLYNTPQIEVSELDRDGNLVKREIILEKRK